ncbi:MULTISPECIES: hypothetical protein [unclassified Streptomyces]|uniref:hypothetical protein n=1 Tax=unclassified Streptomyces TaxID=2593676 RepID=UPI000379A8CC|nr:MULTISPECIES: hypothetical protein [unclassified Streptomyces]MYT33247.1 hypothetical protein [Streptomyces sp. SID8354]
MRTNIRRSIAVAATATGLWALGSVAANAAELPATPDLPAVGTVTGAAGHLPTGAVTGTVQKAAGTATATVNGLAGKATGALGGGGVSADKLPTGRLPQVGGVVDGVRKLVGGAGLSGLNTGDVQKAVDTKQATKAVKQVTKAAGHAELGKAGKLVNGKLPAVPGVPAAKLPGGLPKGLPGVPALPKVPGLPKAPGSADNLLAGLAGAGLRPEQLTKQAQGALATARPVVDRTAADVLPPVAGRTVAKVLPVAQGAVGNAGALAGDAAGHATPFVTVVGGRVQVFAQGAQGQAVPFAQGVAGQATLLAQGVGGDAVPFAQGLTGVVVTDAKGTATTTVAGAQGLAPAVPAHVADLTHVANIPAVPALPVQGL